VSVVDQRAGKPSLRLHLPLGKMNLFTFTDFSGVIRNGEIRPLGESLAQAWRFDGTFGGVNMGLTGYASRSAHEKVGFDATGNLYGIDLYGEVACEFVDALRTAPQITMSCGGSRVFAPERNWTARTEFYFNPDGFGNVALSGLVPGEFIPFYSGRYYAYAEITGVNLVASRMAVSLFGYGNLADGSYSTTLQCTFDLPRILPFTVYGRYYGGRSDREFTRAFGGSALGAGLRIRADF
jgi:hypothetical protein